MLIGIRLAAPGPVGPPGGVPPLPLGSRGSLGFCSSAIRPFAPPIDSALHHLLVEWSVPILAQNRPAEGLKEGLQIAGTARVSSQRESRCSDNRLMPDSAADSHEN